MQDLWRQFLHFPNRSVVPGIGEGEFQSVSSLPSEDGSSCGASPHSLLLVPGLDLLMDALAHSI